MKTIKRTTAVILALVIAFSCFAATAFAAPTIKSIKIVQYPTKTTFYKDTDWKYGVWRFSADGGKGVFEARNDKICFMYNGGLYSYYSDLGMIDMRGLIVEVTYSDGSKKNVEYKETRSGDTVKQNIQFSCSKKFAVGENVIEIYFPEKYEVYTTYKIYLVESSEIRGDVTGDKVVNSSDALQVLRHVVGSVNLTGTKLAAADVNKDSKINSLDALEILKIAVS